VPELLGEHTSSLAEVPAVVSPVVDRALTADAAPVAADR
jgi:hypothetical protein